MGNQTVEGTTKAIVVDSTKLKITEKISYGFGDLASNLIWGLIGSFLLFFYTNVALLPVAATATLFLVEEV